MVWLIILHLVVKATYGFSDVDLDDRRGAEGRLAAVPSLHHQWPGAVPLLGDVLNDGHGLDVGLEHDLPRVSVDIKDVVVWLGFHDGVLDNVVWHFCIVIYSLRRCVSVKKIILKTWVSLRLTQYVMKGQIPLFSLVLQSPSSSPGSCHWMRAGGHSGPTQSQRPQPGCTFPPHPLPSHRSYTWTSPPHPGLPTAVCTWSQMRAGSGTCDRDRIC